MGASILTNTVFGLIRASFLITAIRLAGGEVAGYNAAQAATYVWLSQSLLGSLDVFGSTIDIGERVKSGDITVDFLRPTSILGGSLATNYGRAAFDFLPRGIPPLVIGALTTGFYVPHTVAPYVCGLVSVFLAIALCHCFFFFISLSALWATENRGFLTVATVIQQVLCGFIVPVDWFPGWLRQIAIRSPFPGMFQSPADVLSGRVEQGSLWIPLATQMGWLLVLVLACLAALAAGRRKVVIQGG